MFRRSRTLIKTPLVSKFFSVSICLAFNYLLSGTRQRYSCIHKITHTHCLRHRHRHRLTKFVYFVVSSFEFFVCFHSILNKTSCKHIFSLYFQSFYGQFFFLSIWFANKIVCLPACFSLYCQNPSL